MIPIPILVLLSIPQRYRYLLSEAKNIIIFGIVEHLYFSVIWPIWILESLTGLSDTDTDTSNTSWASAILILILVSLAGAQRYQYQYLVSKAQVSFNNTDTNSISYQRQQCQRKNNFFEKNILHFFHVLDHFKHFLKNYRVSANRP